MPDYTLSATAKADVTNFTSGMNKAESSLEKFKAKCDSVSSKGAGSFGKFVKAASVVGTAVTGLMTGLVAKGGIDRALNIEQAQYKLKQMGMDVQKVMESVNAAAKGTRFGLDSVATVASSLGASGVQAGEDMTGSLKAITGMATLTGRSVEQIGLIYGKVAAQGRVQGDELMQFSEAGINVTDALAKHFNTTQAAVREMVTAGEVDFANFSAAMQEAYGEAAYGANETFLGALANTKAALSRLGEEFAEPALNALKGVFQNAIPAIDALTAALQPAANSFGEFAKMAGEQVSSGLQKFAEVLNATQNPLEAFKAAITETFGEDWGGAINAFVDAFTSVGSVIKDAIQWFVSLDSGTQVAIAQFVAFAAAARPIVSILAGVGSKLASFAQGAVKVGTFLGNVGSQGFVAASGLGKFTSGVKTTATGIKALASGANNMGTKMNYLAKMANSSAVGFRQTGAAAQISASQIKQAGLAAQASSQLMGVASNAAKMLKGALMSIGVGLAIGGAVYVISRFVEQFNAASKAADNYKKATEGLRSASDAIAQGFESAGSAAQGLGEKAANAGRSVGEAFEASAEMADRLTQKFSDLGTNEALVSRYSETIQRLAGNTAGSAQKQGELAAAVDGLNSILGTTYEIVDQENGILNTNTQEIMDNIGAWRKRAEAQAYIEAANEHVKEGIKLEEDIEKAAKNTSEAYQRYKEAMGTAAASELEREYKGYQKAEQDIRDLKTEHDQLAESYYQKAGAAQQSAEQETAAIDSIKQALSGLGSESNLSALASSFDLNLDTMSQKLMEFGVTANDIANMTPQSFEKMANAMGVSITDLATKFTDAGLQLSPAVNTMMQTFEQATTQFSQLGANADFTTFAQNLGLGMDAAALTMTEKCGQMTEVSEQTVRNMALAFGRTPMEIANALQNAGVQIEPALLASLQNLPQAMGQVGTEGGQQLTQNAQESAAQGGDNVAQGILDTAQGHEGEFTSIGLSLGNSLSTGFSQADMASASAAIASMVAMIGGHEGEFMSAGTSAGGAYASGFASSNVSGAASAVSGLLGAVQAMAGSFTAAGAGAGNAYVSGFSSANVSAAAALVQSVVGQISQAETSFSQAGTAAGSGFANAIQSSGSAAVGVAQSIATSAAAALSAASAGAFSSGIHLGSQFASGIRSQYGAVAAAAAQLAAAAKANIGHSKPKEGPLRMGEEIFGRHLAQNFAKGITKGTFYVTRASKGIAQNVFDYLGHSKPKRGPLSPGENVFGLHAMENFAKGIENGKRPVQKQAEAIAQIVYDYIGHSDPSKGPLSPGEWIFGVHTATNYAAGLGSAEARNAVSGAINDLTDEAKKAWDEGILAAYKPRVQQMKDITSDLGSFMKQTFADAFSWTAFTSARGNGSGVFGIHEEIYTTFEKMRKAGYETLDDFIKAEQDYNKKFLENEAKYAKDVQEYEQKVVDIRTDADRELRDAAERRNEQLQQKNAERWKIERDYNEKVEDIIKRRDEQLKREGEQWQAEVDEMIAFNEERQKFLDLKGSFATTDYLWLRENEKLFNFQYEVEIEQEQAARALNNLQKISKKTGVVFTESFVKKITDGSEEAMSLLNNLANATAKDVKQMSEAWYDLEQLQRMQEQSTRELWVNSLNATHTGVQQIRDLLMDYKDTILDVKEAVYSDAGLSGAFEKAGVSMEGFAADLQSVGFTMDDFTKNFTNFTSEVSNGFRAMDSFSQTSLTEWKDNLRQNIAESQAFSKNVAKVFNKIPDYVEADLFRKAVLQGGFDQFGHIMADLAKQSQSQIVAAIELYNESITEAQQSSIEQFRAIAPGEEYMNAFMDGILDQKSAVKRSLDDLLSDLAAAEGMNAKTEFMMVGRYMAAGLEQGLYGQVKSIADAAAAVVRQGLAAAKQAAGVASPSKEMMWIGEMLDRGLIVGIEKYGAKVADSFESLMEFTDEAINALPEQPNYSINTSASRGVHDVGSSNAYTYGDVIVNAQVSNDVDMRKLAREIARFQNQEGRIRGYSYR